MPARVIRAEILASDSLADVSMEAEMVFFRLILVADDFGRLDARIRVLRAQLFPLRTNVTEAKLERWIRELAESPNPPIEIFEVEGRPFIQLTGWEKHRGKSRRAKESKFPPPPQENKTQYRASPEILENPSNPPGSRRVGVGGGSERDPTDSPGSVCLGALPPKGTNGALTGKPLKTICPEKLETDDRDKLLAWAKAKGFTESEVRWAFNAVKDWSLSKGERRSCWVATTRNAMRDGWGLKGYRETEAERYAREMRESPFRPPDPDDGPEDTPRA